jgi:hypothetical protein
VTGRWYALGMGWHRRAASFASMGAIMGAGVACVVACGSLLEVGGAAGPGGDGGPEASGSSGGVGGCPLVVEVTTLDFGEAFEGSQVVKTIPLKNPSGSPITVVPALNGPSFELVGSSPVTLAPSTETSLGVRFNPGAASDLSAGEVTLATEGCLPTRVNLKGTSVAAGAFAVSPSSVELSGPCGQPPVSEPEALSITTGTTATSWTISATGKGLVLIASPDSGSLPENARKTISLSSSTPLPSKPGDQLTDSLSLVLEGELNPRTIPVTATARGAAITFSPANAEVSVVNGVVVTVANTGNAAATIELKTTSLTYAVVPSILTLVPGASAPVVVKVIGLSPPENSPVTLVSAGLLCASQTLLLSPARK